MKWENSLRSQKMLQFHVQFSISLSLTYSHIHALTHSLSHTQTFTVFLDLPTYLSVSLDLFNTLLSVSLSHLPTLSPSLSFFLSFFLSRSCWCKTLVHTTCLKSHTLWLDQRELNPAGYLLLVKRLLQVPEILSLNQVMGKIDTERLLSTLLERRK